MRLTDSELLTLKIICDTIAPSIKVDGPFADFYARCASDLGVDKAMAETIESNLEVTFAEQFRRLLRVFDSRMYNLVLSGRPVRFTRMSDHDRTRYLQAWRDSAIPLKRTAFQAIKRLSCFLYYSVTDASGLNPSWSDIGYASGEPKHEGHPEQMRIAPIVPRGPLNLSCDVCVVGSGAGGSVIAYELSRVGLDVVVLEGCVRDSRHIQAKRTRNDAEDLPTARHSIDQGPLLHTTGWERCGRRDHGKLEHKHETA
jgi:hypothetical protein